MTNFLLRIFVKDWENTEDPAVRGAVGRLAGVTGILCNIVLFLAKLIAGLWIGSVSFVADAVNNLSDAASSVVTLVGFRLSRRPADADHPYGHARFEYLSGLAVAVMILLLGVELAKSSVGKLIHPSPTDFTALSLAVLLASVLLKLWMSRFFAALGKRIQSVSLHAASVDSRNDVIATSTVLAASLTERFFRVNVDGAAGLAVAIFLLYSGVKLAKETVSPLLGKQADAELVQKLTALITAQEKVLGVHDLLIHDYGPGQCFASAHVEFSAGENPLGCHDVIDEIEKRAFSEMNVHLVIHYDPVTDDDREWNELRRATEEVVHAISPDLSIHDFRLEKGIQTVLAFDLAAPYAMCARQEELKAEIDHGLSARGISYPAVIHIDGRA